MNKLEGFYELNRVGIPSVPWKEYDATVSLDDSMLWTIRSAVLAGQDLNLPRKVGVCAEEAKSFADSLIKSMKDQGLVLYYPFFIAEKSGVLEVANDKVVVEAVKEDLWNLVTHGKKDVTIIKSNESQTCIGDETFLQQDELEELLGYSNKVKMKFRDVLHQGKSVFLEWSYAYTSDINKNSIGERRLVFYEIRSVS